MGRNANSFREAGIQKMKSDSVRTDRQLETGATADWEGLRDGPRSWDVTVSALGDKSCDSQSSLCPF